MEVLKTAKVWLGGRKGITSPIRVSQYDTGWQFQLTVYDGDSIYVGSGGELAVLNGKKANGAAFSVAGTFASGVATFDCPVTITEAVGVTECELRLTSSGETVGTANFDMIVEKAPLSGYYASGEDFSAVAQLIDTMVARVPDAAADWLEEHITNPSNPPIDTSLSVSGAAADAKTAGDRALLVRDLSANTDLDEILVSGTYNCSSLIYETLSNYPAGAVNGRLVVFSISGSTANTLQILADGNRQVFYRLCAGSGGWRVWDKVSTDSDLTNKLGTAVMARGSLENGTDINTLLQAGRYFKDRSTSVVNGASTGRAAIISFGHSSEFGASQLWFDTDANAVYFRTMTSPAIGWSDWKLLDVPSIASKTIMLSEGSLGTATGFWASSTGNFGRSAATMKRISTGGALKCSVVWSPKNKKTVDNAEVFCDVLRLFQFDGNGEFVSVASHTPTDTSVETVTRTFDLNASTRSIALSIYNNGGPAAIPNMELKLTLVGTNEIIEIKNPSFGANIANTRWFKFGYKVGCYVDADGAQQPIYNTGMMLLPPNYSADGVPVPTIIMVHGSEAYLTKDGAQIAGYEPFYNFLADCGYALIDCYGWTTRYPDASGLSNPWPMPTTCRAYERLVRLMLDNFNLDRDNLFIMCKSLGGMMCEWLSAVLPLRAAGYLAPALLTNFGYRDSNYRAAMVTDMMLVGTADSTLGWETADECIADFLDNYRSWNTAKREAFYLANEQQIMGWSPEFKNIIGKTASECLAYSAAKDTRQTTLWKYGYPATKIWYADDDDAISPTSCSTLAQQIRNGGGEGVTRVMPTGTGGHHSVDTDVDALKKLDVVTPLGVTYETVPLAYYELWQWFEAHRITGEH